MGSQSPFWERHMVACPLQSAPPEGGPDFPIHRQSVGKESLLSSFPQPEALETRVYFEKANHSAVFE